MLLASFQNEIQSGRLNFVFFQSGPKFNTFGMDNYYGSPFYMVNNGQDHWAPFNQLKSNPNYQTDLLSLQWFSLAHKYAVAELDTYRRLIFDNTRAILNRVALFTPTNDSIYIAKVDPKMDACFIDIKTLGYFSLLRSYVSFAKFYYMMRKQEIIPYSRAAFGFFQPNYIIIDDSRSQSKTIRINPGINAEHNEAIVAYLAHLVGSPMPEATV
jgi:hypothetical protein